MELACDFATGGGALYELGHPVAELLPALRTSLAPRMELVRIDESEDLSRGIVVRDASVAIMVGISQQMHPRHRSQLLADVYRGLRAGGCALVMEMVRSRDSLLNNLFATHTREADRDGPHDLARMVQIASTLNEEYTLLSSSAFRSVEIFYRRYGLCGLIAIK